MYATSSLRCHMEAECRNASRANTHHSHQHLSFSPIPELLPAGQPGGSAFVKFTPGRRDRAVRGGIHSFPGHLDRRGPELSLAIAKQLHSKYQCAAICLMDPFAGKRAPTITAIWFYCSNRILVAAKARACIHRGIVHAGCIHGTAQLFIYQRFAAAKAHHI